MDRNWKFLKPKIETITWGIDLRWRGGEDLGRGEVFLIQYLLFFRNEFKNLRLFDDDDDSVFFLSNDNKTTTATCSNVLP